MLHIAILIGIAFGVLVFGIAVLLVGLSYLVGDGEHGS